MMKKAISITFLIFSVQLLAQAPSSSLAVADSLYAVGNYSEAIEQLEGIKPKSEVVYLKLAKAQQAKGNPSAALKNYKTALENNPDRILTTVSYGKLLMQTGQLTAADSIFSNLVQQYPGNANFHYHHGLIKEKQRDSTAMKSFTTATLLDNTHQLAIFKVAKNHISLRRYAQAVKLVQQGLKENPANVSLRSLLAQAYYNQKSYDLAIPEFLKLVELGEGNEFVHSKLGYAYNQQGEYEKAIEQFNEALVHEDKNFVTHHSLGKLYALTGDLEKSELHLLMAILLKKQPMDGEFLSLGLTYKLAEDYEKALEYLNKALEENPENERALYERAIAADNYFEDLETRKNFYQAYLNKFEKSGNKSLVHLAKRRINDINEELFLQQ